MSLNLQVFTDAGLGMLSAAEAGGTLTITKIVAGSGTAAADADLYPLVALLNWQVDVPITRKTDLGKGVIIVSGAIAEAVMTPGAAWSLKELGIMAKVGSGPEQLYTVSNVYADPPDTVTPGGTATHAFDISVAIGRATTVNITLGDPNSVDCQNIPSDSTVGPGVYASRAGNIFQFKRLVPAPADTFVHTAGSRVALTEVADRITVALRSVESFSLNLYVPPTHPQCPDPSVGFATVELALEYLSTIKVGPYAQAIISVDKGTFNIASGYTVTHNDAPRILIQGAPQISKAISAITYVDATHKHATVSDVTGLVIGQRAAIVASDGAWAGGGMITNIIGLVVTLSIEKRDARPAYTTANVRAGASLVVNPTVFVLTSPTKCAFIFPNGLFKLLQVTLDGGAQAYGIWAQGGTVTLAGVHIWNAATGIRIERGAHVNLTGVCVITQCGYGLDGWDVDATGDISGPTKTYINACATGCHLRVAELGSTQASDTVDELYLAHNQRGLQAENGGAIIAGNIRASNNDVGIDLEVGSCAEIGDAGGPRSFFDNNGVDLQANGRSYIQFQKLGATAPTCNPAAETSGNTDSLIHLI